MEVSHYPPGTSKCNKIEHRLFCHITRNWRGLPLESHQVVVHLVSSTRNNKGLEVHRRLDEATYEMGRKITTRKCPNLISNAMHFTVTGIMKSNR